MKTRFATLNFVGSAAIWLQAVQLKNRFQTWEAMYTAVCAHFDKDQYPLQMKQLESLRQSGSVADYQAKFQELAHNILLYNPSYDDVFFVTRFLGGFKEEIRGPIVLHRPQTLEEAGTLALLQEAELECSKSRSQSKPEAKDFHRFQSRANPVADKSKFRKEEAKSDSGGNADKLVALKAYRRANNLCFTCGEKWTGRNHKCPTQIPLHIIQELLDAMHVDPDPDYASSEEDSEASPGQVVMSVQQGSSMPNNVKKNRTMRLRGFIGKQEVLILVDSGSARTFVSQELAAQIKQDQVACDPLKFTAADGSQMLSDKYIPHLQWHLQGHCFTYDTRILPLKCYDMILGADWLEDHSPMWIHWKRKLMKFTHNKKRVVLKGVSDTVSHCTQLSSHKLKGLLKKRLSLRSWNCRLYAHWSSRSSHCMNHMIRSWRWHQPTLKVHAPVRLQYLMFSFCYNSMITYFRSLQTYLLKGIMIITFH
jgi:hypothetical protein